MSRPLFLFRPEPGWSGTEIAARSMGLDVAGQPLFDIEPTEWTVPEPMDFEGLLAGSANAFRLGSGEFARLGTLPVFAVGKATAEAARSAGFYVSRTGDGSLQDLVDNLVGLSLRLLRLTGEAHVPLAAPEGIVITEVVVYRAVPQMLSNVVGQALGRGGVVVLHSGEAAAQLRSECERLGIDRAGLSIVALAPRVAGMVGEGWGSIHIAPVPTDSALLALAVDLCQTG